MATSCAPGHPAVREHPNNIALEPYRFCRERQGTCRRGGPSGSGWVASPPHRHCLASQVAMPFYGLSKRGGGGGGDSQTNFSLWQGFEPVFLGRDSGNCTSLSVPPPIICILDGFCHCNQTPCTNCTALLII